MANKNTGLGRGFDALLPKDFDESLLLDKNERVQKVSLSKLKRLDNQPRKSFDDESLRELANSIKVHGILQPLIVSPDEAGGYVIVAGERRFRAAKLAGLESVPIITRTTQDLEKLEIALVENVQRVDLSPLEQAAAMKRLHDQFNLSYEEIGIKTGKNPTTIANQIKLVELPQAAKDALNNKQISEGHARTVLFLSGNPSQQTLLLNSIIKYGWNVRQAEQFVVGIKKVHHDSHTIVRHMKTETIETKALGKHIKAPVTIRRTANGGKLEIGFKTDDDLSRIIKLLSD